MTKAKLSLFPSEGEDYQPSPVQRRNPRQTKNTKSTPPLQKHCLQYRRTPGGERQHGPTRSEDEPGRRTFRDVGERFVPDRHQRQQVEEESDERPDQQTTAADTQRGTSAY